MDHITSAEISEKIKTHIQNDVILFSINAYQLQKKEKKGGKKNKEEKETFKQ